MTMSGFCFFFRKEPVSLEGVMELVARKLSPRDDDDNILHIDIRRDFVLKDALHEGRKRKFNTNKQLEVSLLEGLFGSRRVDSCISVGIH